MAEVLPILGAVVQYGALAVVLGLLVVGILRVGKLVDAEREAERKRRDDELAAERKRVAEERAAERAEWARREAILTGERDQWRDRSTATDERLDRVIGAFERLAKAPAPE